MVRAHAALAGLPTTRVTTDADRVIHLTTARGRPARVHRALTNCGYVLTAPGRLGTLSGTDLAHRYRRWTEGSEDIVDLMRADHVAPAVMERLGGHDMMPAEGTTQALRRTVDARRQLRGSGPAMVLSIPDAYEALILKTAAHLVDRRNPAGHLRDAVILLACLEDPYSVQDRPIGFGASQPGTPRAGLQPVCRPTGVSSEVTCGAMTPQVTSTQRGRHTSPAMVAFLDR